MSNERLSARHAGLDKHRCHCATAYQPRLPSRCKAFMTPLRDCELVSSAYGLSCQCRLQALDAHQHASGTAHRPGYPAGSQRRPIRSVLARASCEADKPSA